MERVRALCAKVGFEVESTELIERLRLLDERSDTLEDATRMAFYAERVFHHYEEMNPAQAFDPLERKTVLLACLFSDIGKTGPANAAPADCRLVADAFAVENVKDDKQAIATFLETYFPDDASHRRERFVAMGIDPALTLRQFWNCHSNWTLEIAERAGLPPEAVAAAATHHLLEEINPEKIVGDDGRFTRHFGDNPTFDRTEKLVILLDKYDAVRRRGKKSHDEAIAWLEARLAKSPRFSTDESFLELLGVLSTTLRD